MNNRDEMSDGAERVNLARERTLGENRQWFKNRKMKGKKAKE